MRYHHHLYRNFSLRSLEDVATPPATGRWHRIVDWLGGCRPLSLIAGACGLIALVSVVGHLLA
jgi:hypothetical protein